MGNLHVTMHADCHLQLCQEHSDALRCEEDGRSPQPRIILLQDLNRRAVTPADSMLQRSVAPSACSQEAT